MEDGKKLYFATRNVGEISPSGIASTVYRWGATEAWEAAWTPETVNEDWPTGHKLDAAHDMAAIQWGGDWHTPSIEEWNLLVANCDYERKEADESGYGVAGYFFYKKKDQSQFIFLPVAKQDNEINYWTSEIYYSSNSCVARTFNSYKEEFGCIGCAGISTTFFSVRPVISAIDSFNANGHDYVDLDIKTTDGKKLYFATMNVGETSPAGCGSEVYRWGATVEDGMEWAPDSYYDSRSLNAAHDIATITWGEKWHTPSRKEWTLLVENCDYERKEADESGYGVAGYFFYNKSDRSKFIFLSVSTWNDELAYWTSEIFAVFDGSASAYTFSSVDGKVGCLGWAAGIESTGFAVRPVFVE
jgi:hypothetical protein